MALIRRNIEINFGFLNKSKCVNKTIKYNLFDGNIIKINKISSLRKATIKVKEL